MSTTVHSTLTRTDTGMVYTVTRNGQLWWETTVRFGRSKTNRAGGPAFQQAAREQDRQAQLALTSKD